MNLPPCPSPPSFIELPPFVPLKPCNDNNSHVRMDNEPPKPVLEPSPTFAWTRRDPLRPVSPTGMSGLTPPSSPLAFTPSLSSSSSLSPSSALRGFGFGPIREVRMGGINPRGNNIGCGEEMSLDEPIQLPPIRDSLPADSASKGMEGITTNNYNVTRFVPVKTETNNINSTESTKGKKLGVSPVSFKKSPSERKTLSNTKQGKIAGILVVHTTTQSTVTSVERKVSPYPAPVSPPFTTTTFTTTTTATPSATLSKKPTSTKNLSSSLLNNTHNNTTSDAVACDGNRRRVTPDQLVILEREFERGMIPDLETRKRLAKQLGFTERRVQVWFQNRRAKMKKDNVGPNTPIFIVNCGIDSFKN